MPTPIPNREQYKTKKDFEGRYKSILGKEYDKFIDYSLSFLRRSIRVNTLKISIEKLKTRLEKKKWILEQIPWCREGYWVNHEEGRRDIGNTIEFKLGYIYVQEAASMIPPIILDPKPGELVVDMCASPGSKTTQIAQYMENSGILIANDVTGDKMKPLAMNIQRMGIANCVITLMAGQWFKDFKFDKVLVDAPCSGTGTIRKSLKTLKIYNINMFPKLAKVQRQLIETGYSVLKKGGTLVYSTCSTEPEENEGVVSYFLNKHKDAEIKDTSLNIKRSKPLLEFNGEKYHPDVSKCLRIWPHDNDTDGFFVAKIVKL
ncbi:RsmB/NOP family class I SAM-dependent RNA methyltransferase [Candidatus Woesearchaeota archaeon]|nr:RsmB/NOP family class I SAM-dependent RNA methyltransferase [Candidatus Woesearchaeota archaeon]